jgi:hypothetical protein
MEENKIEEITHKFVCEKCNFRSYLKTALNKHLTTVFHLTGVRKKRTDYKESRHCDMCDYSTRNNIGLQKHILNNHKTLEEREKGFKFFCQKCNYGAFYKDAMDIHYSSNKHKQKHHVNNPVQN